MRKKTEILKELMGIDFFGLAKKERHPRTRIRLLALGHIKEGKSRNEIAQMFCVTTQAIRQWVNRFLLKGLDGIQEGFRSGRRKKLQSSQEENFRCEIEKLQRELEGGRIRALDIQVMLKEKFAADYALSSVYHLLERTQMHGLTARSKHPKADKEAQENFKKTL
jgi:transposase